jgi:protein TonB
MLKRVTLLLAAALMVVGASGLQSQSQPQIYQPAKILSTVQPAYPPNTVSSGTVVLEVTVAANGEISGVKVVAPSAGFTDDAIATVRKWQFTAATLDGKPVASEIPVAFSFSQPTVWWNGKSK